MAYKLGERSERELQGVHPDLVRVIRASIEITEVDFGVLDGLRTIEEQEEYVRTGVSKTMDSKHLPQDDGTGHAGDLVPYINGKYRWEIEPLCKIAETVRIAAKDLEVPIRWGGCWARLDNDTRATEIMVEQYVARRRRQGRRFFIDAPHFELIS